LVKNTREKIFFSGSVGDEKPPIEPFQGKEEPKSRAIININGPREVFLLRQSRIIGIQSRNRNGEMGSLFQNKPENEEIERISKK
jgi:hypothetical protein